MSYKDTLELYDELIKGGCSEAQARAQAHQLGGVADEFGKINNVLERIEKDLWWMRAIGAGMIIACFGVMFK